MRRLKRIGDSEYGRLRDEMDLPTTREQDDACIALEQLGQRFLVDYGYQNAIEKLGALREHKLLEVSELM